MAQMKWAGIQYACQQGWYRESRPFLGEIFLCLKIIILRRR